MARETPPTRLAADPSTSAVLRAMVTSARASVPSRATVLALGVRLDAAIAANVAPPAVELPETLTEGLPADASPNAAPTQSVTQPAQSGAFDTSARVSSSQTGPSSSATSTTPDVSQSLGTLGAPSPSPVSAVTASAGWSVGAGLALMLGGLVAGGIWLVSRGDDTATDATSTTRNAPSASVQSIRSTPSADAPAEPTAPDVDPSHARGTADGNARVPGDTSASGDTSTLHDPSTTTTRATATKTSPGAAHHPPEKSPASHGLRSSAARASGDAPSGAATPTSADPVAASEPGEEAALLSAARAALTGDPARALRITTQHAQRFPKGHLVQEREVIAIAALRRLGRTSEAQRRGAAFEQHYPGSVHRSRIEQTLEAK